MTRDRTATRRESEPRREREHYDPDQRRVAALLQRDHPSWVIMYGPWSRRFWAYATLPAPPGLGIVLSARDPGNLVIQMRGSEGAAGRRPVSREEGPR